MRIFKNAWFVRFARKEAIDDRSLREAVERAERGLVDADLGGGVLKQRVARTGQGKSGGYRTIVFYMKGELAIFVYGFAKSERDNIDRDERDAFRKAASHVLKLTAAQFDELAEREHFVEIG